MKRNFLICCLGQKAYISLEKLLHNQSWLRDSLSVVIGKDNNVVNDYRTEILELCTQFSVETYLRENFSSYSKFDIVIAIGWRWLIDIDYSKLIVFHDSLLPRYRGFAPLVNAALNREPIIGVTALLGHEEYDRGDILLQREIRVEYPVEINFLIKKVSIEYSEMILEIFEKLYQNIQFNTITQNESDATYSVWLDDEDYFLDWCQPAVDICNKITLLGYPYSHAKSMLNGQVVLIKSAELISEFKAERYHPGKVISINNGFPIVMGADGALILKEVTDLSGKSILPLEKFRVRFC
ncbi:methionyl-tRNA formyltransferase [Aeromonas veronii]|uniref:methionyl-tRNA formyltransferase n=1 Tax=Aeromonas veronii TaxID=654 RepID=UPI00367057EC